MGRILGALAVCVAVVVAFALGSSCYTVPEPDCGFVCGAGGACPDDYACASDNFCHKHGSTAQCTADAGIDATGSDAGAPLFYVLSTSPSDGQQGVGSSALIDVVVTDDIDSSSVSGSTFIVVDENGTPVSGTLATLDSVIQWTPAVPYASSEQLDVELTGNIVSQDGQNLEPYSFTFFAADYIPPTVVSTSPMDGDTNVLDAADIIVTFSEPVIVVSSAFTVDAPGPVEIDGTISTTDMITYTFTPTAALPAATVITVSLGSGIEDYAANPLSPVQFSFTTQ